MVKTLGLSKLPRSSRAGDRSRPVYRAVTQDDHDAWTVVDAHGFVVYRGDARVAAMIASRLTRQS